MPQVTQVVNGRAGLHPGLSDLGAHIVPFIRLFIHSTTQDCCYNLPSTVLDPGDITRGKEKQKFLPLAYVHIWSDREKKTKTKIYSMLYGNKDYGDKQSKVVS